MSVQELTTTNNEKTISDNNELARPIKKNRPSHLIWNYFSWNRDNTGIICNICEKPYSSSTGVSTIKGHFAKYHKNEWEQIELQNILPIKPFELYGIKDENKIAAISSILLRWIICYQLPFSIVEDDDFKTLIAALNPLYKLPSRQTISIKIQSIYEKQCESIKEYFKNHNSKVSLTTDVWTACTNQAYMSITLHWIDNEWKMHRILLDLIPLHERHTGTILANTIYTTINYFGLGEKIIAVTTDNASNMNVFGREFTQLLLNNHGNTLFRHIRCAAHILNLIVKDGLNEAGLSIKKAREFMITIRSSQVLFEELKDIFDMKKRNFLVPEIDVTTRWNSTYMMIEKLRKIRDMTDILVVSNPLLNNIYPNDDDWKELNVSININ
jgi:hypothetical protein